VSAFGPDHAFWLLVAAGGVFGVLVVALLVGYRRLGRAEELEELDAFLAGELSAEDADPSARSGADGGPRARPR
jgi:hypothetical protein